MNLNISKWGEFRIGDLFYKLENGKANNGMLDDGSDRIYLGAKKSDNGVMRRCASNLALEQDGNCIIFICNGQGSVGYANYMNDTFIGTSDIVAGYCDNMNEFVGEFMATVFCLERPKYSFGRKWKTHLKDTVVKLPMKYNANGTPCIDDTKKYSDEGFIPDWQFMEGYIKSLHHKPLTTKNKAGQAPKLDVTKWGDYRIGELFNVKLSAGDIKFDEIDKGNIPLVSSGETDNGIIGYIDKKGDGKAKIFDGNQITIDMFGNAHYQNNQFYAVSHGRVNILQPKFALTPHIGLFITTIINKERYKYSYGRAVYSNVSENMYIRLPQKAGGSPNWQFMEDYIKSLPYGDRLNG